MCVLFGPEVVLKNAFAAQGDTKPYIEVDALRKFCDILNNKIAKVGSGRYKYVYFELDQDDLEEYCEEDEQFVRGINRIYVTRPKDKDGLIRVNSAYTEEIRDSLKEARKEFAAYTGI